MPLGTLDRTPPPFFRQGPSATTRLVFFAALSIFLMASDTRFGFVEPLRATVATALLPAQQALQLPMRMLNDAGDHLGGLRAAVTNEREARAQLTVQAQRAKLADELVRENQRLRGLLELRPALRAKTLTAEVVLEAADPFSRKVFIDRGSNNGVQPGSPVVNEQGLLGQVTRVYPLSAEVTLLTDRDISVPVLNLRTQQRSATSGGAGGGLNPGLELRFMAANADVQAGDPLVTSGLDGIYPPGLAVAKVQKVERRADSAFARIELEAAAQPGGVRHVLVLEPLNLQLPPLAPEAASAPKAASAPAPTAKASTPARLPRDAIR
jgi:rod shape-determining protein MreC